MQGDAASGSAETPVATRLADVFAPFDWVRLVVLFGSCARSQETVSSDIDVAVLADRPLGVDDRKALINALAVTFGRPVDLVDLRTVGEPLLSRIVAEGVVLRGSRADWAQVMYRNSIENADFVPLQNRLLKERRDEWIAR